MSVEIVVEPWPQYGEDGGKPIWIVTVIEPKRSHKGLKWSSRLGRFSKSWTLMNLRRGAPSAYREAAQLMRDFCAKGSKTEEVAP